MWAREYLSCWRTSHNFFIQYEALLNICMFIYCSLIQPIFAYTQVNRIKWSFFTMMTVILVHDLQYSRGNGMLKTGGEDVKILLSAFCVIKNHLWERVKAKFHVISAITIGDNGYIALSPFSGSIVLALWRKKCFNYFKC